MKDYTDKEIEEQIARLPVDLQTAIGSVAVKNELQKIAAESHLHVDNLGALADLVDTTLAGLLSTREFLSTLTEILPNQKREVILSIAEAVNKQVFFPVHESLHKIDLAHIEKIGEGRSSNEQIDILENPTTLKLSPPSAPPIFSIPPSLTIPVVPPASVNPSDKPIHEAKLSGIIQSPPSVRDISYQNRDQRLKMIPDDVKAKINSDPYKEPIE